MKKNFAVALLALSSLFAAGASYAPAGAAGAKAAPLAVGAVAPDFTLPDADGKQHTLASLKGKSGTVILFVATRCPVSNAYNARMQKLAASTSSASTRTRRSRPRRSSLTPPRRGSPSRC
jgi:cytochrome oxidase Cu insertion factor (SCO1/SenC/PrrC family)